MHVYELSSLHILARKAPRDILEVLIQNFFARTTQLDIYDLLWKKAVGCMHKVEGITVLNS